MTSWKWPLAFCFLAALALSAWLAAAPGIHHARLVRRSKSESWVERANAAAAFARLPDSIPDLLPLATDEHPRVRQNALWALNRLTGWPWASQRDECLKLWAAEGIASGPLAFKPAPEAVNGVRVLVSVASDDAVDVVLQNTLETALKFSVLEGGEQYFAAIYHRDGTVIRVLDPEEPLSGTIEVVLKDAHGRAFARYWWHLEGLWLGPGEAKGERFVVASPTPGAWGAEAILAACSVEFAKSPKGQTDEGAWVPEQRVHVRFSP